MPLKTLAEVLGSDTARGLTQRHALAREAEDRVALMERRSPVRLALNTLALALHEQAFRPGRSGGAWPTAALLSVALLQVGGAHLTMMIANDDATAATTAIVSFLLTISHLPETA